jgi:basic amino acid/polyamine antiporter, APA family
MSSNDSQPPSSSAASDGRSSRASDGRSSGAGSSLARVLGVPGAVLMGLGSIVGTGIFVSIGTAAGVAGSSVLLAVALAAIVATCNGLSSAQLAAAHPVSGGAYEYGYRYATPTLGRIAGWMFVCAKTASAATAALGFSGYALALVERGDRIAQIAIAAIAVVVVTVVVAGGISRSSWMNTVIVGITLVSLATFIIAGLPHVELSRLGIGGNGIGGNGLAGNGAAASSLGESARDIVHATALMFVAYTGYGRIATLGEEVRDPARTIPRAIVITLLLSAVLYIAVTAVAIGAVGADQLAAATSMRAAPLEIVAGTFSPTVRYVVAIGAITAMLGVMLNLVLGISRVVLAMARRHDLPHGLARVHRESPRRAVLVTGAAIAALTLIGNVKTTWSLSAFSVLVYYGVANYCALRQPVEQRRFPRSVPWLGLASCLGLAVWLVVSVASD